MPINLRAQADARWQQHEERVREIWRQHDERIKEIWRECDRKIRNIWITYFVFVGLVFSAGSIWIK